MNQAMFLRLLVLAFAWAIVIFVVGIKVRHLRKIEISLKSLNKAVVEIKFCI